MVAGPWTQSGGPFILINETMPSILMAACKAWLNIYRTIQERSCLNADGITPALQGRKLGESWVYACVHVFPLVFIYIYWERLPVCDLDTNDSTMYCALSCIQGRIHCKKNHHQCLPMHPLRAVLAISVCNRHWRRDIITDDRTSPKEMLLKMLITVLIVLRQRQN